jgi:hypothetical protein
VQLTVIEKRLNDAGVTYLLFSSHSFGRADKPGVRCRLVVPVDIPLDSAAYKRAAQGLNVLMLDGLADQSGFALHQQQGTWATAPERAHLAFRRVHKEGVCSSTALLEAVPNAEMSRLTVVCIGSSSPLPLESGRIKAALEWLNSNNYTVWFNTRAWLKAAYGDTAYPLWLAWSMTASDEHRADEEQCATAWAELAPRIPAGAGAGKLFKAARDEALRVAKAAGRSGQWNERAKAALVYLQRFHAHVYDTNFAGAAA